MFRKVTTVMVTVFLLLLSVPYRNIALAADSYTPIYTKADLDAVRKDLDGRYRLMNDLKFSKDDFSDTGWLSHQRLVCERQRIVRRRIRV